METVFKIVRLSDGLFSSGGTDPSFSKKGKQWKLRGHVTLHLGQCNTKKYAGCVVREYEIVATEKSDILVSEWKELPSTTRQKELDEQRHLQYEKEAAQRRIAVLEKELMKLRKM